MQAEETPKQTNHRFGVALAEQVEYQHTKQWAQSPAGYLARIALQPAREVKDGNVKSTLVLEGLMPKI